MNNTLYNGWANYETWNVNLWLLNCENLYDAIVNELRSKLEDANGAWDNIPYTDIREMVKNAYGTATLTPDGVSLDDARIDWSEISDALLDIADGEGLLNP